MAIEITKETLKSLTLDEMIQWCRENGQIKWLKEIGKTTIEQPIYPKKTVADKNGKPVEKVDRKAEPIGTETVPIPYVNIKREFVKAFYPELMRQPKEKKLSMWEIIANLEE